MPNSDANSEGIWTIIASIAAVLSGFYAFYSNILAKQALKLARQVYKDTQSNFDLYLIDNYRWIENENQKRKFLLFNITIRNKSNSKNSYKANLEIEYVKSDNNVARILIEHNPDFIKVIPQKNLTVFPTDIRIEEKGYDSKWLIFQQPTNAFEDYRIEKYSVKITDTQNNTESVGAVLIKELRQ